MKLYFEIFITFFKISSFTFGGGYAILPLLMSEISEKNKWMSEAEITDIFTMSQVVPGLLYASTATFIGFRVGGIIGAILATIAVLLPSTIAIMALILFLKNYFDNIFVQKLFKGIIIGVTAITGILTVDLIKKHINSIFTLSLLIISFILLEFFNVKSFYLVLAGIIIGIIYASLINKQKGGSANA